MTEGQPLAAKREEIFIRLRGRWCRPASPTKAYVPDVDYALDRPAGPGRPSGGRGVTTPRPGATSVRGRSARGRLDCPDSDLLAPNPCRAGHQLRQTCATTCDITARARSWPIAWTPWWRCRVGLV